MTRIARLTTAAATVAALIAAQGCATSDKTAAQPPALPSFTKTDTRDATFVVLAVDHKTRHVKLQGEDGKPFSFTAGPDVRNLAQVQVGDTVKVTYHESIAIDVTRGGTPDVATASYVGRAAPGEKPAGGVADVVTMSATIVAIDRQTSRVTLQGPEGNYQVVQVKDPKKLENVQTGDLVTATYTESLAISVATVASPAADAARAKEALEIALDAYVYGYPLVTMEYTRRVVTNVEKPVGTRAPMGHVIKLREYPNAKFRDVTAPNADTLYTTTFLDVSKEPWILSLPDMKGRYYLMPMLSGWTDVFQVPGKRTTGTKAQRYAITGPGWSGKLPAGVKEYRSPTGIVWILGRIYCTGTPKDYAEVHALQDKITVVPLSAYGKKYAPPPGTVDPTIEMKKPVRDQVDALDAAAYFDLLAALMKENPPSPEDAPTVARLAKIGLVPGQRFDVAKLDPAVQKGLADVPKLAQQKIMGWFKGSIGAGDAKLENGWLFSTKTGLYGTSYLQRAFVTAIGLGANRPHDAIYPTSEADSQGKPYDGSSRYVMHFPKGQLPPAEGFWSLTMYDADYFFVDNPLNRHNVSSRSKFKPNADGSVDVYVQHDSPGKAKESNWLPAPAGRFILMMRLYWPREKAPSLIDGSWTVPAVTKVAPGA